MIPISALGVLGTGLLIAECYFPKIIDAEHYQNLKKAQHKSLQKAILACLSGVLENSSITDEIHDKAIKNTLKKKKINEILCDLPQDLLKIFSFSLMLSTLDFYFISVNSFPSYSVVVKTVLCFFSALTILRATCLYGKEMYRYNIMFEEKRAEWVKIHMGN